MIAWIIIEPIRIHLGIRGNLKERVPDLLDTFGFGFTTPFEFGLNLVYLIVLVLEVSLGYKAARQIAKAQTAEFFLAYDQNRDPAVSDAVQTAELKEAKTKPAKKSST
ncbi:hypothetical protein HDU91_004204, partial [Kappamyces sp. JEL0680]